MSPNNAGDQSNSRNSYTVHALRQREKELRRSRGQIACAECRRLKLRCDRKIPCSSCIRRGCRKICPNGSLSANIGPRLGLPDNEELHLKLADMSERIRLLEDALDESHTKTSEGPHPLLCNDLKAIKYVVGYNIASEDQIPRHIHDPLESFGTLKISDDGESRFLGPSAGSEGILLSEGERELEERKAIESKQLDLPPQLRELAQMWPFTPINLPKDDIRIFVETQLPPLDHATALYQSYLDSVGWYNMPVDLEQIVEELLPSIYKPSNDGGQAASVTSTSFKGDNHELAVLLMVFACGAAMDPSKEPTDDEGRLYYDLARVVLGLQPIFERSSLATVQALTLMAVYDIVAIRKSDLEECRKIIFLAAVIAGSIGLHRDPARWKLDPRITERRRKVFWETYMLSTWQCLSGGRPPPIVGSSVDVQFPQDPDAVRSRLGQIIPGYKMWKFQFVKECLAPVTDRLCADTAPLKYYEIVNFDKKIREFPDIEILRRDADPKGENERDIANSLKNKILCYKGILRLYLHRNFFGKAISDFPGNPRQPPYGMSFLTVFNVAVSMLDMLHQESNKISNWIIHFWTIVAHALECGFIVGSVATRCPRTSFAEQGLEYLNIAIELFESLDHPVAKNGLPVMLRLREKARQAKLSAQIVPSSNSTAAASRPAEEEDIDELSILRGSSRLVAQSSRNKSRLHLSNTETSSDAFSMLPNEPAVQVPLRIPLPLLEEPQIPSEGPFANTENSDPLLQSFDLGTGIDVGDQIFARLLSEVYSNPSQDFPLPSNFLEAWH